LPIVAACLFAAGCSTGGGAASADAGALDQAAQAAADSGLGSDSGSGDGGMPVLGGGGLPDCFGSCCTTPRAGTACDAGEEDASCSTSVSCGAAGPSLTLPYSLVCNGEQWLAQGGDCGDGGIADNGCPTSQPQNAAACTLPNGTSCQYGLVCAGSCDAGASPSADAAATEGGIAAGTGCATVFGKVGPAICRNGQWQTEPLGTCP